MRTTFMRGLAALLLVLGPMSLTACDREDVRDVEEGVDEADKEIDKLDSDGKDD